jgi:hypothetical protein
MPCKNDIGARPGPARKASASPSSGVASRNGGAAVQGRPLGLCLGLGLALLAQQPAMAEEKPASATTQPPPKEAVFRQDSDAIRKEPIRINPGDKRPADQFKTDVFGRPLTIGGAYELEPRYTEDRRLDPDSNDDIANVSQDLKLEFFYPWSKALSFFIQSNFFYNPEVYAESGDTSYELGAQLSEAWFFYHRLFDSDFSTQIGRQRFADKRQWWWNQQLDAGRVYFGNEDFFAEFSVANEFGSKRSDQGFVTPVNDHVLRLMGDFVWQWDPKQNLTLFYLTQFDNSKTQEPGDLMRADRTDFSDGDLTWIGARAMGKFKLEHVGKIGYWLDSAFVTGRETTYDYEDVDRKYVMVESAAKKNVLAWGMDAGVTLYSNLPLEPYFTVGYAYGSGDSDPDDGTNTTFRQSGIQNNKVKFSGSQRFRYYGELFRPELSNLRIATAALGFPLSEESSVDLLYHHYEQAEASDVIRDSRIRARPNGRNTGIGDEVDLVLSLDEWEHLQVQFAGSVFKAGNAFGELSGNTSFQLNLTIKYSF